MEFCPNGSSHGIHSAQHKTHNTHTDSIDMHTDSLGIHTQNRVHTDSHGIHTHGPVCVYFVQPDCTLTAVCVTNEYDVMFTFLH